MMGKGSGSGKGAILHERSKETIDISNNELRKPSLVETSPKGFTNVGNSCYANAALQCLLSTSLTHALLQPESMDILRGYSSNHRLLELGAGSFDSQNVDDVDESVRSRSSRMSRKEKRRQRRMEKRMHVKSDWLTRHLTLITREYVENEPSKTSWFYRGKNIIVDPSPITKHPDRLSKCLTPYQQEDAHEFMRALLTTLTMNGENKRLSSLFDGLLESAVTCQVCRRSSLTRDRYMDLSLDIVGKHVNTLGDAMCEFTKTEFLDCDNTVFCENCAQKQPVAKGLRLATAPSILVCHLKRFSYNDYGRMVRLHKHLRFPLNLEIGDYMSLANKATPPSYELVGVLVHQGRSCESGHYIAYVKSQNEWYKANDSQISKADVNTVLSQQAYILMYEVAGMRSTTMKRFPTPLARSRRNHVDMHDALNFDGSIAPNSESSIFDILCGVAEVNDALLRDLCCGGKPVEQNQDKDTRTRPKSPKSPLDEMSMQHRSDRIHYDFACDGTIGESTIGDETVYTTDSSQLSGMRRSTSVSNLRQIEDEASRAYRGPKPRTHSAGPKKRCHSEHKKRPPSYLSSHQAPERPKIEI